ncbi:transcription termination/antitermination protein NusA [Candidatus Parcubacteria bacterium]|nr:transcription termination/antitermination protein NusA [Candidatus Parcubacteria bacterium]
MSDLSSAIKHVCDEKGLDMNAVISTIEYALAAAYRKDFGQKNQNIVVEFDSEKGTSKVYDVKTVVEDMPPCAEASEDESADAEAMAGKPAEVEVIKDSEEEEKVKNKKTEKGESSDVKKADSEKSEKLEEKENEEEEGESADAEASSSAKATADKIAGEERKFNPKTEIQISDAKLLRKTAKIGNEIKTKLEVPDAYGRMAAQTAKQVIIQRLREAEREMIFNDFKEKEHEVISGVIQRREGRIILVDLGKSVGIIPPDEQIMGEKYNTGDRVKVYVKEVALKPRGPEIILSRVSEEILKKIFYLEIPEISNGLIELKSVAREAGSRSKVAVWTDSENVDPIGSCVGQRGSRIQTIINELGGEKVDIIEYDEDTVKYISNALSPAKIGKIDMNEEGKKATVTVPNDQLSLAIGKGGQNARLAAKLTGWKIDIVEDKTNQESGVKNEKSEIKNEELRIKNEESEIKNQEEAPGAMEDTKNVDSDENAKEENSEKK